MSHNPGYRKPQVWTDRGIDQGPLDSIRQHVQKVQESLYGAESIVRQLEDEKAQLTELISNTHHKLDAMLESGSIDPAELRAILASLENVPV